MENIFQIITISIVQGVTEFLPVSSSAHLNLLSNLFGFKEEELINKYKCTCRIFVCCGFFL